MSTTSGYIEFVCDQIRGAGAIRFKKMFGEYMVYVNDSPVLLVCDDTVYVKKVDALCELLLGAATGFPYQGAKEHYILDIDNAELSKKVVEILKAVTPPRSPSKSKPKKPDLTAQ